MAGMKRLAKDTAIYGLSSIVGRFLNWCLFPIYTFKLGTTGDYGVVNYLYGWTTILMVLLTYGMETGFFRYANKSENDSKTVYSTVLTSVGFSTLLFILLGLIFAPNLANAVTDYGVKPEYISMLVITVAFDAFCNIPFAYLRYKHILRCFLHEHR